MMFNFWVNQHLFYALASGDARPLAQALRATARSRRPRSGRTSSATTTSSTSGGSTRSSVPRCSRASRRSRACSSTTAGSAGGSRRCSGDPRRLELRYSLLFSLPGTPVLRYGEEIGMGDDLSLPERNAVRTPMQWSDAPHAGFTTGEKPVRPVVDSGPYAYEHVNVARQQREPGSHWHWLASMIRLRNECPEIGWGEWKVLPVRERGVLAIEYRWRGTSLLCVHNFDAEPREVRVRTEGPGSARLISLTEDEDSAAAGGGAHRISLEPYAYRWYRGETPAGKPRQTRS